MPKIPRFAMNPDFERELTKSPQIGEILQPLTAKVAEKAKTLTRYKGIAAGISATVGARADGKIVGRVVGNDFKTGWAEFGTSRFPQERALGRALEEVVGPVVKESGS